MSRTVKVFLILIFTLVLTVWGVNSSDAADKDGKVLTLSEFIREASLADTRFEAILIDALKLQYKKALGLPAGDFVLSLKSEYNFLFNPDEGGAANTVSLSKLFPFTGTEITAGYESALSASARRVTSEFEVKVTQPIAENAFGRNTRLLDRIIGMETDIADFQIVEAYEDYLASVIQLYYNWYSAYENVKTAQNSYDENMKLLENMKERQRSKIALPLDVNKVSLQVTVKKEGLITLENKYSEYLNLVKEAVRYDSRNDLRPQNPTLYQDVVIDFKKDYLIFSTQSRTSRVLTLLEDKSSLEVDKYADQLLPSIDLIAGYSLDGAGDSIKSPDQVVFAGISMDWPLPGAVERARYETSQIDRKKAELSSENIHFRLRTNLKNLNDQIVREEKLVLIAQEKINYAQSIVDEERKNYSLGRVSLNDLIDEVNKLEENKFNLISREVQLKRLIVEWLRLTDSLIKKNQIVYRE